MSESQNHEVASHKRELLAKIEEMEFTLRGLHEKLREAEEHRQHEAIDHLEEYLGDIDNKYAGLRDFWEVVRKELKVLMESRGSQSDKD